MREDLDVWEGVAVSLKAPEAIERMRRSGAIVAETLDAVRRAARPGVTTADLDALAEATIRAHEGASPAFKGYRGFPATLCVSVNEEVVHGIPSKTRFLRDGDVVSIDVGARLDGYYGDAAMTVAVGQVGEEIRRFLEITKSALMAGIDRARPGNRLGDIGAAIQNVGERHGYSVVRSLVGHGIGSRLHEEPQVPNYGRPNTGMVLREGLVLAIEPMFNMGGWEVRTQVDEWTVVTSDGSRSAHFEHTVAVTREDPEILTGATGV